MVEAAQEAEREDDLLESAVEQIRHGPEEADDVIEFGGVGHGIRRLSERGVADGDALERSGSRHFWGLPAAEGLIKAVAAKDGKRIQTEGLGRQSRHYAAANALVDVSRFTGKVDSILQVAHRQLRRGDSCCGDLPPS